MRTTARIFVVDDHPVLVQALKGMLASASDLVFAGAAHSAAEALEVVATADPDLVMLDLSLDGGDGLDLLGRLLSEAPTLKVLVFSMHGEAEMTERVLAAGARGYVAKTATVDEIFDAIRTVLRGETYVGSSVMAAMLQHHKAVHALDRLTPRELNIFYLLASEPNLADLGQRVSISRKTVETHVRNIREKLGLATTDAVRDEARRFLGLNPPT